MMQVKLDGPELVEDGGPVLQCCLRIGLSGPQEVSLLSVSFCLSVAEPLKTNLGVLRLSTIPGKGRHGVPKSPAWSAGGWVYGVAAC